MSLKIYVPRKVCSDIKGYQFLANLYRKIEYTEFEEIILDFSTTKWFEANLCAALGAVINEAQNNLNTVTIINLQEAQHTIFSKNHFLASFGGQKIYDVNETTIKYRRNKLEDDKLIKEFLDRELLNKPDFPTLSPAAKAEIIRSIFEIYSNAVIHGNCKHVYSCGQFYPNKNPPRIDFTIVDVGNTIKKNVNEFLEADLSGIEAVKWALEEHNTTKQKKNNIPGGLGLKIICEFAKMNKGKVHIVSSNGYWESNKGSEKSYTLDNMFPGTLVNLEFNLSDDSFYYLKDEQDEEIIF